MLTATVITVSDRVARGESEDRSGPALAELLRADGYEVVASAVVSDDPDQIIQALRAGAAQSQLVVTTGGTGLAPRDRTPEATAAVADYLVPGLAEEMRRAGLRSTPNAALSRGLAAVIDRTLVINLPGSPSGAMESLEAIAATLPHAIAQLSGGDGH